MEILFAIFFAIFGVFLARKVLKSQIDECLESALLLGLFVSVYFIILLSLAKNIPIILLLLNFAIFAFFIFKYKKEICKTKNLYLISLSTMLFCFIFAFVSTFFSILFGFIFFLQACIFCYILYKNQLLLDENLKNQLDKTSKNQPLLDENLKNQPLLDENLKNQPLLDENLKNQLDETSKNKPLLDENLKNQLDETSKNKPLLDENLKNQPLLDETFCENFSQIVKTKIILIIFCVLFILTCLTIANEFLSE